MIAEGFYVIRDVLWAFFESHKDAGIIESERTLHQKCHAEQCFSAPGSATKEGRTTGFGQLERAVDRLPFAGAAAVRGFVGPG